MLARPDYLHRLSEAVRRSPVTALLGPRQCGKTTLAKAFGQDRRAAYFDLESVPDQRRLQNPEMVLGSAEGLVILDEIQAFPQLFQALRVVVDRQETSARFLLLGSASPEIVRGVSESLAGRIEFVELSGFDLSEVGAGEWQRLWLRGGFPRSYLAGSDQDSLAWREGFIRTFLERDVPQLGVSVAPAAMRRFWTMLAHYHGQTWNASELARAMALSDKTVRAYLDLLTGTFLVRQLQPWHENLSKRQVKAPKVYLRDAGLLHSLLSLSDLSSLTAHPRVGASWEGFALEQVLRVTGSTEAYFWATHGGAELDLLLFRNGRRYGVELKFSEAPVVTRSMRTAVNDLGLERLWVVHPGRHTYPVDDKIAIVPLSNLESLARELGSLA